MLSKPFTECHPSPDPVSAFAERPGILPEALLLQIQNTIPWVFPGNEHFEPLLPLNNEPQIQEIRFAWNLAQSPGLKLQTRIDRRTQAGLHPLDHHYENTSHYFKFLLSAHYSTCASFIPTDVDVSIREKLWRFALENESTQCHLEMIETVIESLSWPTENISRRYVHSNLTGEILTGHQGEWFSTAAAAYGSLQSTRAKSSKFNSMAEELVERIYCELQREHQVFLDHAKSKSGLGALKAAVLIAHNLGDLERVLEAWGCDQSSELTKIYKLAKSIESLEGELNRQMMALENHRHLSLREPGILRTKSSYLLGIGPFFDSWGRILGSSLDVISLAPVVEALVKGWERAPTTSGYARALLGILESIKGGSKVFQPLLPAKTWRTFTGGPLQRFLQESQSSFEESWARRALKRISSLA